jgi:hypothetical protein
MSGVDFETCVNFSNHDGISDWHSVIAVTLPRGKMWVSPERAGYDWVWLRDGGNSSGD